MSTTARFLWGFAGSAAVEVVTLFRRYNAGRNELPVRYRHWAFWAVRFLVAVVAGGLAVAYGVNQPLLAVNVGAATPLLIRTLSETSADPSALDVRSNLSG